MKNNIIKKLSRLLIIIFILILSIFLLLFIIRIISASHLDDVTPMINCETKLLATTDVLFVIPIYQNSSIADNKKWCEYILSLNKTLGMHGVYHEYQEFATTKNQDYINLGIIEFEKCFGYKPEIFKSPQQKINSENYKLLSNEFNMKIYSLRNTFFHKVYHCSDTGKFSNRFHRIF